MPSANPGSDSPLLKTTSSDFENSIDAATFDELSSLLNDELSEFISAFIADTEQRMAMIENAVDHSAYVDVGQYAHSLKGSALNLGATGLANCCSNLELAARSNNAAEVGARLTELKGSWLVTRTFMIGRA